MSVKNPKRDKYSRRGSSSWFEYYAGFSPDFVQSYLESHNLDAEHTVLDPWNGSGTTTEVATALGLRAIGFDLNPVMVMVARAKMLHRREKPSLAPLSAKIGLMSEGPTRNLDVSNDPLSLWLCDSTISCVRQVEYSIQELLVDEAEYKAVQARDLNGEISDLAAFFYTALFRTVRILIGKFLGSNPTWVKTAKDTNDLVLADKATVLSLFQTETAKMILALDQDKFCALTSDGCTIEVAASENLPLDSEAVDIVLSSPPYCTRIDYAVATRAELAVLGFKHNDFRKLRDDLMGTSSISGKKIQVKESWGSICKSFLESVEGHSSKASSTYYLKNHLQYFESLFLSFKEIGRVLKNDGLCSIVVQDSFYKDIHNDLPGIVIQMAKNSSLRFVERADFLNSRSLAGINPNVKVYRTESRSTESVLLFQKESKTEQSCKTEIC